VVGAEAHLVRVRVRVKVRDRVRFRVRVRVRVGVRVRVRVSSTRWSEPRRTSNLLPSWSVESSSPVSSSKK